MSSTYFSPFLPLSNQAGTRGSAQIDTTSADWDLITGVRKAADNATRNDYYVQSTLPTLPVIDGALWKDTSITPPTFRLRAAGTWVDVSTLVTSTSNITDGAGLGLTAQWSNIVGQTNAPENSATRNNYYVGADPGAVANGSVWKDSSNPPVFKLRVSNAWVDVSNLVTNTNQVTDGANLGKTAEWGSVNYKPSIQERYWSMAYTTQTAFGQDWSWNPTDVANLATFPATTDTDGVSSKFGDNSGNDYGSLFAADYTAFEQNALYEIEFDVEIGASAAGASIYLGVQTVDAAGANLSSSYGSYNYIVLSGVAQTNIVGRAKRRCYFKGTGLHPTTSAFGDPYGVAGSGTTLVGSPTNPSTLPIGTVKFRPMGLFNYNIYAGQVTIHSIRVRKLSGALSAAAVADFATQVGGLGVPSLNAGTTNTLVAIGSVSRVGNTLTKTGATSAWDAGYYTGESSRGNGLISYKISSISFGGMAMISSVAQRANPILEGIALYQSGNSVYLYQGGVGTLGTLGTVVIGDVVSLSYDGVTARAFKNGAVFGTPYPLTAYATTDLVGQACLYYQNDSMTEFSFQAASANNFALQGGPTRPSDNAGTSGLLTLLGTRSTITGNSVVKDAAGYPTYHGTEDGGAIGAAQTNSAFISSSPVVDGGDTLPAVGWLYRLALGDASSYTLAGNKYTAQFQQGTTTSLTVSLYVNGSGPAPAVTVAATGKSRTTLAYDGDSVMAIVDGVVVLATKAERNQTLYPKVLDFYQTGNPGYKIKDVLYGPWGEAQPAGLTPIGAYTVVSGNTVRKFGGTTGSEEGAAYGPPQVGSAFVACTVLSDGSALPGNTYDTRIGLDDDATSYGYANCNAFGQFIDTGSGNGSVYLYLDAVAKGPVSVTGVTINSQLAVVYDGTSFKLIFDGVEKITVPAASGLKLWPKVYPTRPFNVVPYAYRNVKHGVWTDTSTVAKSLGESMIYNGNAELGNTDGWLIDPSYAALDYFVANTGAASNGKFGFLLYKTSTASTVAATGRAIPVVPGKKYVVRVSLNGSGSTGTGLYIRLNQRSSPPANGTHVVQADATSTYDFVANGAFPSAATAYSFVYTIPAGITHVSPQIINYVNGPLGCRFDDFVMAESAWGPNAPDDNATRNRVAYTPTDPGAVEDGYLWTDTTDASSPTHKVREGGTWRTSATVGAKAGLNLRDSAGTVLADAAVKNSAITINPSGTLSGAGSGSVTLPGLGYDADLNRNNLIDTSWWRAGATIPWGLNSETNTIEGSGTTGVPDARGGGDASWKAVETSNNGDQGGGWSSIAITLDPTRAYRFVVPIYRVSGSGSSYWGCTNVNDVDTATANANPYFAVGSLTVGRWYLFVGYIFPAGSTGNSSSSAGVWDCLTGLKSTGGQNFCFKSGDGSVYHRAYQYYASNGATQLFGRPMVNLIDGNEPSLQELMRRGALAGLDTADYSTYVSGGTKPENNATVGARAGTNLKAADGSTNLGDTDVKNTYIDVDADSGGTGGRVRIRAKNNGTTIGAGYQQLPNAIQNLDVGVVSGLLTGIGTGNNTAVANSLVTVNANGTLGGAGAGSVTIGGLGFSGDLDSERNSRLTIDTDAGGTGGRARVRIKNNGTAISAFQADDALQNLNITIASGLITGIGTGVNTAVANTLISLNSTGTLSGGSGGSITALDFANTAGATKPENNADVTITAQVEVDNLRTVTLNADQYGTVIVTGQLPKTITPTVTKGGVDKRTDTLTTYAIVNASGGCVSMVTVNNTGGSADKGRQTISTGITASGFYDLQVTYNSVVQPLVRVMVNKVNAPPSGGGGSGGTKSGSFSPIGLSASTTSYVELNRITGLVQATGETIRAYLNGDYDCFANLTVSGRTMTARWEYSTTTLNSWTAFSSPAGSYTGTGASWNNTIAESSPGSITCNQTAAPAAGTYDIRLVVLESASTSGCVLTFTAGTSSVAIAI